MATLARLTEDAQSHLPKCEVSSRPTLGRGRRFQKVTRMPNPSSGLGSCSHPAQVQEGQWTGLQPRGWESPHPSCFRSSVIAHACPLVGKGWKRQGSHQSPRKDRASFLQAMLPDFLTAEALTHRESWKNHRFLGQTDRLRPGVSEAKG